MITTIGRKGNQSNPVPTAPTDKLCRGFLENWIFVFIFAKGLCRNRFKNIIENSCVIRAAPRKHKGFLFEKNETYRK